MIENIFGIVKQRFKILKYGMEFRSLKKCADLINALFAIHNFILENGRDDRIIRNFNPNNGGDSDSPSEGSSDEEMIRGTQRRKKRCVINSKSQRILDAHPECFLIR